MSGSGTRASRRMRSSSTATFVQRWRQPYSVVGTQLRRALEAAKKVGEMRTAAYALSATVIFEFAAGRELDGLLRDIWRTTCRSSARRATRESSRFTSATGSRFDA